MTNHWVVTSRGGTLSPAVAAGGAPTPAGRGEAELPFLPRYEVQHEGNEVRSSPAAYGGCPPDTGCERSLGHGGSRRKGEALPFLPESQIRLPILPENEVQHEGNEGNEGNEGAWRKMRLPILPHCAIAGP